ncbi:hypothetical protein [Sphingomonas morindae]|uniref:Flap endonuclease-1-like 5' DNA nuclease n=1 Tax=Sphingomonas morindae TaxID=1541170 RepID=A0ABY4X8V0_9SPHN|nr:hypothetical protein [Sphingomonas morindae]USI73330.1 hypothetical protein LHA26_02280 [Sphingomonas morindae]
MTDTTLLLIGAAVLALALLLFLLARSGRKPPEGPAETGAAFTPVLPDQPLPDPTLAAALPELDATPAIPVAEGPADDLTRIKGLGPKAQTRLNALGITRYDQLAALDGDEVARIDAQMGPFAGRFARDRWVEQARFLAADDRPGFEAIFGKLG